MRLSNPACPESVKPLLGGGDSFVPFWTPPLHSQPGRAVSLSQGHVTHPFWPRVTAPGWSGVQVLLVGQRMGRVPPLPRCGYVAD